MKVNVSAELKLPTDVVTSTGVVYGGKGMGKTSLLAVLMEELARCGLRFSAIDAMGVLWGIRFDLTGKGPGIEVLILGGIHGDIPIEPTGGSVVADLVADEDVSVVIDISRRRDGTMWSISERVRFVTDYCKRLYMRQGEKRRPILQLIDEAARFAPQMVRSGEMEVAACMGAVAVLVEEGRNVGIGCWLFTQRSARLNKDVAELADSMIAFRTSGPNSVKAVLAWMGEHVESKKLGAYGEKLRGLPRGTALVISSGWLGFEGFVPFRARSTFDSSATPKAGESLKKVSNGAKPDLDKYAARMAETIERALAADPKALQAKVASLQAELKKALAVKAPAEIQIKERYVFKPGEVERFEKAVEKICLLGRDLSSKIAEARSSANPHAPTPAQWSAMVKAQTATPPPRTTPPPRAPVAATGDATIGNSGLRRMLIALAQRPQGLTNRQLGVRAGVSSKSGTFSTYLSKARANGWIEGRGDLKITEAGIAALGSYEPLPEGAALAAYWISDLGESGAARMLRVLVDNHPNPLSNDKLGELANISAKSGTFSTYLSKLRSLELVTGRGELLASAELFE